MSKVGIVIVTYEPNNDLIMKNIRLILESGYTVIVVDNSEDNPFIFDEDNELDNLYIISMGSNQGIAKAQNIGVEKAVSLDCDVIGFFDQDSCPSVEMIKVLVEGVTNLKYHIVAPVSIDASKKKEYPSQRVSKYGIPEDVYALGENTPISVDIVISSGTFVHTSVFDKVGKFDESLFIDFVDIEWCMRCKYFGEKIYVLPSAVMEHTIGENIKRIGFITISVHSPYRTYYKVRNSFIMLRKRCPKLFAMRQILPAIIHNAVLLFGRDGYDYRKYFFRGIGDGIRGKGGKYGE